MNWTVGSNPDSKQHGRGNGSLIKREQSTRLKCFCGGICNERADCSGLRGTIGNGSIACNAGVCPGGQRGQLCRCVACARLGAGGGHPRGGRAGRAPGRAADEPHHPPAGADRGRRGLPAAGAPDPGRRRRGRGAGGQRHVAAARPPAGAGAAGAGRAPVGQAPWAFLPTLSAGDGRVAFARPGGHAGRGLRPDAADQPPAADRRVHRPAAGAHRSRALRVARLPGPARPARPPRRPAPPRHPAAADQRPAARHHLRGRGAGRRRHAG